MPHWLRVVCKNFETAPVKFAFLTYTPYTFNDRSICPQCMEFLVVAHMDFLVLANKSEP